MTEKRFTSKVVDWWHNVDEVRVVFDNGEWIDADDCAKLLNALHEENEQLKLKNKGLKSELTIHKTDIQHSTMIINELHDKNKQTKEELDYIQNSISNAIKHQKTELGVKALQEIIADYNEGMLGHKEVKK